MIERVFETRLDDDEIGNADDFGNGNGFRFDLLESFVFFGRDGRMSTYLAMVLVTAISLWWAGFGPRGRA